MHVDAVRAWDVDADEAERVELAAGVLPEGVAGGFVGVPVDRFRRDLLPVGADDPDLVLGQVVRFLAHLGDQILADDRGRNRPSRVEVDLGNPGLQDRRLAIDLADAGRVARGHHAAFDRLDHGGGNIDHHIAMAKIAGEGAQAHDVQLKLADSGFDRHIQRRDRSGVQRAGRGQAMARLKTADGLLHERIEGRRAGGAGVQVACDDQAVAQGHHTGAARADAQALGADGHPAALPLHLTVALESLLGCRNSTGRHHRCAGAHDPAAGLHGIIGLAPLCGTLREGRCGGGGGGNAGKQGEERVAAGQVESHDLAILW